jgi:hypothetical protein
MLLIDEHAWEPHLAHFLPVTFYGQLQNIFVMKLPSSPELGLKKNTTLILAAIHKCNITLHNNLNMHYYQKDGPVEVMDILSAQCLVGRIKTTDKKNWVIIDHSGDLACLPGTQTLKYICNTIFLMFLVVISGFKKGRRRGKQKEEEVLYLKRQLTDYHMEQVINSHTLHVFVS